MRFREYMRFISIAICINLLAGCSMATLGKTVIRQTPNNISNKSKSIAVAKIVDTIDRKKVIGKSYGGLMCLPGKDLYWYGDEKTFSNAENIIKTKLSTYSYTLVGKVNSPFNTEYIKQSELLLGGKLVDVEAITCFSVNGSKGEMYIKIEWEIYDTKNNNIVLALSTEGYAIEDKFNKFGSRDRFEQSLDMAIDNLLAKKEFYSLLTK